MTQSYFDQLGGFKKVRKVVSSFYDRVLEEEVLIPYFEGVDMPSLIDHQTKFFATLLGGPASYTDDQLRKIHSGMGITSKAFEVVCELVVETLEDHGLDDAGIRDLSEKLLAQRSLMVEEA
jgi:hemoglobin